MIIVEIPSLKYTLCICTISKRECNMPIKFINQSNRKQNAEIRLERNCKIENIDPKKGNKPANELSFALSTGQTSEVWLPNTQYKLFEALASANDCDKDDDIDILTIRDLMRAKERYGTSLDVFKGLGVKEFRCDLKAGVVNITTNKGEVLRVDLETKAESRQNTPAKSAQPAQKKSTAPAKKAVTAKTTPKKPDKKPAVKTTTQKASSKPVKKTQITQVRNKNIEGIISKFKGGNINISQVHDLQTVAKYTGISERYIKDILVGIEGKQNWPLTKAEYDGVKDRTHPRGYLTIGFGHTSLTGEPTVFEGMQVNSKQAYQILANDIMTAKKYAKYFGGELYNKAPSSIKNAMIDLVFNKGPGAINESLKANLSKGYFHSAALRTWYATSNVGLQKRNMHRFIEACKSLNNENKRSAVTRFRKEHLNELINVFKKDHSAKIAWNNFCMFSKCKDQCF